MRYVLCILKYKPVLLIFCGLALLFLCLPVRAQVADGLEISPHIIDTKAQARDILEYDIKIKNSGDRRVTLYVLVYDLSSEDNNFQIVAPEKLDKSNSITRWVRISRGAIELDAGQETSLPLKVEVNLNAKPGKYYSAIVFSRGRNITTAEQNFRDSNQLKLLLNIEVEENIIEKAQLNKMEAEKNIFLQFPANFYFSISNSGNRDIIPRGYLYVYNRKNQEIAKIPANAENIPIPPEAGQEFKIAWSEGKEFGKFKAKLELEYGEKTARDLSDTVYFWILPWRLAAIFGGGLLLAVIILVVLIFKKTYMPTGYQFPPGEEKEPTVDLREDGK